MGEVLLNANGDWARQYPSPVQFNRWQVDGTTENIRLQKPYTTSRNPFWPKDAVPFYDGKQWRLQRKKGTYTTFLPIILLPDMCNEVYQSWVLEGPRKTNRHQFAVQFSKCNEGARVDDVLWIIDTIETHQQTFNVCLEADKKQASLLKNHPRRAQLLQVFQSDRPLKLRSDLYIETMRECLAAEAPSCCGPKKMYEFINDQGKLLQFLGLAKQPSIVLFEDPKWTEQLPSGSPIQIIWSLSDNDTRLIDVQDSGLPANQAGSTQIAVLDMKRRWTASGGQVTDSGLNLLNLAGGSQQFTPPGLLKHCDLLREACDALEAETSDILLGKRTSTAEMLRPGKQGGLSKLHPIDMQSSQQFAILGQAGVMSGWHMDLNAPFTSITVVGDEETLKYWPVIDFNEMTKEEVETALSEFAKHGSDWMPERHWIKTFCLTTGMTLIMPPGTIHAPITATDCLCRGSMCMDKRFFVSHHLHWWLFSSRNRTTVVNEEPSKQTERVLRWIINDIKRNPALYQLQENLLEPAISMCEEVIANLKECECKGGCFEGSCYCHGRGLKCVFSCGCMGKTGTNFRKKRIRSNANVNGKRRRKH